MSVLCVSVLAEESNRYSANIDYTFKAGNRRDISRLGILVPVQEYNSGLLFSNIFGLYDSRDAVELNLGFGYRELFKKEIVGISTFYDKRKSNTGNIFSQLTFSLEYFRRYLEFRLNGYAPVGTTSKSASTSKTYKPLSYLKVTQSGSVTEKALWGYDVELGGNLPSFERLTGFVAYYHFNDNDIKAIHGVRFRSSFKLNEYLSLEGEIAHDRLRDINYLAGVRIHLAIGGKSNNQLSSLERKMTQMVIRDIDIITDEVKDSFETDNSKPLKYQIDWNDDGAFIDATEKDAENIDVEINDDGSFDNIKFKGERKPLGYVRAEKAWEERQRNLHELELSKWLNYKRTTSRLNALGILGLDSNATNKEIKKAYRKLARKHHPDKGGEVTDFQVLNEAYGLLVTSLGKDWIKFDNILGKSSYVDVDGIFIGKQLSSKNNPNPLNIPKQMLALTLSSSTGVFSPHISGYRIDGKYRGIIFESRYDARLVGDNGSGKIESHDIKGIPDNLNQRQLVRLVKNSRFNIGTLYESGTNTVVGYTVDTLGLARGGSGDGEDYGDSFTITARFSCPSGICSVSNSNFSYDNDSYDNGWGGYSWDSNETAGYNLQMQKNEENLRRIAKEKRDRIERDARALKQWIDCEKKGDLDGMLKAAQVRSKDAKSSELRAIWSKNAANMQARIDIRNKAGEQYVVCERNSDLSGMLKAAKIMSRDSYPAKLRDIWANRVKNAEFQIATKERFRANAEIHAVKEWANGQKTNDLNRMLYAAIDLSKYAADLNARPIWNSKAEEIKSQIKNSRQKEWEKAVSKQDLREMLNLASLMSHYPSTSPSGNWAQKAQELYSKLKDSIQQRWDNASSKQDLKAMMEAAQEAIYIETSPQKSLDWSNKYNSIANKVVALNSARNTNYNNWQGAVSKAANNFIQAQGIKPTNGKSAPERNIVFPFKMAVMQVAPALSKEHGVSTSLIEYHMAKQIMDSTGLHNNALGICFGGNVTFEGRYNELMMKEISRAKPNGNDVTFPLNMSSYETLQVFSDLLGFVPIASNILGGVQALTGVNVFTNQKVNKAQELASAIGGAPIKVLAKGVSIFKGLKGLKKGFSVRNVSTKGARTKNFEVNVSKSEFEGVLKSNGFSKTTKHIDNNKQIEIFKKGNTKYTTRDFSKSTQEASGEVYKNGKIKAKIRFKE